MDRKYLVDLLEDFIKMTDEFQAPMESSSLSSGMPSISYLPINKELDDKLMEIEIPIRQVINGAQSGLGNFKVDHNSLSRIDKWTEARSAAIKAKGIYDVGAKVALSLSPDSPVLTADKLHSWVWDSAKQLWESDNYSEAVAAVARTINSRIKQKVGRGDVSDKELIEQVFSPNNPEARKPRLRMPGDRHSQTWKTQQLGAMSFGIGCFQAIRNIVAHEADLEWNEIEALEFLAAFSILARWIDECELDEYTSPEVTTEKSSVPIAKELNSSKLDLIG